MDEPQPCRASGAPAIQRGLGFQADLLDFVYARVNRREPRQASREYARVDDYALVLAKRIAASVDMATGSLLDQLDAVRTVLTGMAMELAYRRGMRDAIDRVATRS